MTVVKLTGGLGNQMFQYAHGKAVAHRNNEQLFLDTSWYEGRIDRSYILDYFNIDASLAGIIKRLFAKKIVGDFQSENHFREIEETIRKEFTLKNPPKPISDPNSVSIHLRGGDYVRGKKSGFHGTCSPEYYEQAVAHIKTRVDSPHFYIFTDDIEWAKNHIKFPQPFTLMSEKNHTPVDELFLMSSCIHNIIANSTFSWWAAWLNQNPKKIVIAPKKWFNNEVADASDIVPLNWLKL